MTVVNLCCSFIDDRLSIKLFRRSGIANGNGQRCTEVVARFDGSTGNTLLNELPDGNQEDSGSSQQALDLRTCVEGFVSFITDPIFVRSMKDIINRNIFAAVTFIAFFCFQCFRPQLNYSSFITFRELSCLTPPKKKSPNFSEIDLVSASQTQLAGNSRTKLAANGQGDDRTAGANMNAVGKVSFKPSFLILIFRSLRSLKDTMFLIAMFS